MADIPSDRVQALLKDVKINIPSHCDVKLDELHDFPAFKTWITTFDKSLKAQSNPSHPFHDDPYKLGNINIQSVDRFSGSRLGFVKFKARVENDAGERFAGSVFMRGGSVAMLLVLRAKGSSSQDQGSSGNNSNEQSSNKKVKHDAVQQGEEYVILTTQPRIPAGSLSFTEIPAGMLDDSGTFSGAAAKEIEEETGLTIEEDELVDLTQMTSELHNEDSDSTDEEGEETLQAAMYPSPGGSDEFIPIFYCRKDMAVDEIEQLQGKLTGLRDHGEKITLRIVRLHDAWKIVFRDGKSLAALSLLDCLRREGKVS